MVNEIERKGSDVMLEIADKEDVKRLENEIAELRTQINNMRDQIQELMRTHEALRNLVSTIGGKYTY